MKLRKDEILQQIQRINETNAERSKEYYAYLKSQGKEERSLEEYLNIVRDEIYTGEQATDAELAELERIAGMPLPEELREFYQTLGKITGGRVSDIYWAPVDILPARELLKRLHETPERYLRLKSLGLIDRILLAWGNDRFEFNPEEGYIKQETIDRLNREYIGVGEVTFQEGEAHRHIYFDRAGNFGSVFYHQDAFDELRDNYLRPMLKASPANGTLSELILKAFQVGEEDYDLPGMS